MKPKRNIYLDIAKLLAAFCVIFIHVGASIPATKKPDILLCTLQAIARFAVPFFFIVSGYFSFRTPSEKIKKRLKKTAGLIIIASLLYFAWDCFSAYFITDSLPRYFKNLITFKTLADFIFLETNPVGGHLWFLNSLFVIYIFYYFYTKLSKNPEKPKYQPLYIAAALLFCMLNFISIRSTASKINFNYFSYRNSILFGFPFFTLGIFIRQYYKRIVSRLNLKQWKLICAIIVCVAISAIQTIAYSKTTECPPFTGLAAALLFILCLMMHESRILAKIPFLRQGFIDKLYLNIYIIHLIFIRLFTTLSKQDKAILSFTKHRYRYVLLIIGLSTAASVVIVLISNIAQKLRHKISSKNP